MDQAYLVCSFLCAFISLFLFISAIVQPPSKEQKILTVLSICLLLLNSGSAMMIANPDYEASRLAMTITHYGGVHIAYCVLYFLCVISRVKIHRLISIFMIGMNLLFVTFLGADLFLHVMYKNVAFERRGNVTLSHIEYATGFWIFLAWNFVYFIATFVIIIISAKRGKYVSNHIRACVGAVIFANVVPCLSLVISVMSGSLYDLRFLGSTIGVVVMYFTIYRADLLEMREAAQNELLNELDDIVFSYDQIGRLVFANKKACEIIDLDLELSYGIPVEDIGGKFKEYTELNEGDEKEINGHTYVCSTRVITHKNRTKRHVVRLTDVTDERNHLNEVLALKKEAETANLAKSMFLSHMSHEIRTPINSIIGMDEMILRESNNSVIRGYASDVMKSGQTLITLINDLLEYSKIESGNFELEPTYYMVENFFKDIHTIMKFKGENKNLTLIVDIDPSLPRGLYGDGMRIRQILTQLIDNAIKYTEKGTVSVTVSYDRIDDMNLKLRMDVRDTGIGIKESDLDSLFGDFDEIFTDSTHRTNGIGLGMTIVRRLLNLMGGSITVQSTENVGSCFRVSIPQIISDPATVGALTFREEPKKPERVDFKAPEASILVVDDVKTNRTIAKLLVKNSGINFDESDSGEKALEMIKAKHYDLILLDQRMPGLTGVETLQKMSETDHLNKGVPVVALTADAEPGAEEFYASAGFTEYMAKPLDPTKYETMLIRLIPAEKIVLPEKKEPENKED